MGPLRAEKAIIHQDGRGSSSPKAKGHIEGLWVDLLVLSIQSQIFDCIIEVKLNVAAPPAALRAPLPCFLVYFGVITIWCDEMKWFSLFSKSKALLCSFGVWKPNIFVIIYFQNLSSNSLLNWPISPTL